MCGVFYLCLFQLDRSSHQPRIQVRLAGKFQIQPPAGRNNATLLLHLTVPPFSCSFVTCCTYMFISSFSLLPKHTKPAPTPTYTYTRWAIEQVHSSFVWLCGCADDWRSLGLSTGISRWVKALRYVKAQAQDARCGTRAMPNWQLLPTARVVLL
jgi:hypothetical protein